MRWHKRETLAGKLANTDHIPPGHFTTHTPTSFPCMILKCSLPKPIAILFTAANALPSPPTPEDRQPKVNSRIPESARSTEPRIWGLLASLSSDADTSSKTGTLEPRDGHVQDTPFTVPRTKDVIAISLKIPFGGPAEWRVG